jgi:hypothetical protein
LSYGFRADRSGFQAGYRFMVPSGLVSIAAELKVCSIRLKQGRDRPPSDFADGDLPTVICRRLS